MQRKNIEIANDYNLYTELTYGDKSIHENQIQLVQKPNNIDWLQQECSVTHISIIKKIDLTVEKKKSLYKYGIKLTCKEYTKEPYFRFDSDGPAHRNKNATSLSEQQITTPHFNCFNESGLAIAYKSDILKSENESKAIVNNIDFGLNHFFKETNINQNSDIEIPTIEVKEPGFFDSDINDDPLDGVNFID